MSLCNIMTHWSQFVYLLHTHTFTRVPSLVSPHPTSIESHDQPSPKAITTGASLTPYIYCVLLSIPPTQPNQSVPRCQNNTAVCVWPKVWEAASSVSRPLNNALPGRGGGDTVTNSTRILPLAPAHPIPMTCGPQ